MENQTTKQLRIVVGKRRGIAGQRPREEAFLFKAKKKKKKKKQYWPKESVAAFSRASCAYVCHWAHATRSLACQAIITLTSARVHVSFE